MTRMIPITTFLALLATATPLVAQGGGLGLKGGLSLGDLTGDAVEASETRQGLNAGGSFMLLRFGPLQIGPELYYAQKGAGATRLHVESPEMFDSFGLDYLEIPLIGKIGAGVPGLPWVRAYVQGGPAYGWRLNCVIEQTSDGAVALNDECAFAQNQDARAFIDSADRGAVFGGGLDITVLNMAVINLDARHVRGLARLAGGADDPEVRNRATSMMIGFNFGGFRGGAGGGTGAPFPP